MNVATKQPTVTGKQYDVLQHDPVALPTPDELFDFQVGVLESKGLGLSGEEISRLCTVIPREKPQLFLLVPGQPDTLDLDKLMLLIEVYGKKGYSQVSEQELAVMLPAPKEAHMLLDVEDGRGFPCKAPSVLRSKIHSQRRLPYFLWHGLVHAIIFPRSLQGYSLDLVCACSYLNRFRPVLTRKDGTPVIACDHSGIGLSRAGAPSSGRIVGLPEGSPTGFSFG